MFFFVNCFLKTEVKKTCSWCVNRCGGSGRHYGEGKLWSAYIVWKKTFLNMHTHMIRLDTHLFIHIFTLLLLLPQKPGAGKSCCLCEENSTKLRKKNRIKHYLSSYGFQGPVVRKYWSWRLQKGKLKVLRQPSQFQAHDKGSGSEPLVPPGSQDWRNLCITFSWLLSVEGNGK